MLCTISTKDHVLYNSSVVTLSLKPDNDRNVFATANNCDNILRIFDARKNTSGIYFIVFLNTHVLQLLYLINLHQLLCW